MSKINNNIIDPEILSLLRETIASVMRDVIRDGGNVDIVDDMVNNGMSQGVDIGGEGIDSPGSGMCGAFAFDGSKINVGGIYKARRFARIEGIEVPEKFTGYAYVEVHMGYDPQEAGQVKLSDEWPPSPTDEITNMMLYSFVDGTIREDYRGSPHVQMWE